MLVIFREKLHYIMVILLFLLIFIVIFEFLANLYGRMDVANALRAKGGVE
jgi:hypothetical protein